MATRSNRLVPARAIHPGEILGEELQERGIRQKDFARLIGVQPTHLNEFIKGKRNLNDDLAMKLERHLGIPYKTWMGLHTGYLYDLKAIDKKMEEERQAIEFEHSCSDIINLKCLYKRLGMNAMSCVERVSKLKELFPFNLLSSGELRLHVDGLYKHSEKAQADDRNMLTWLVLNWLETSRSIVEHEYVQGNALKAAREIAEMANSRQMNVEAIRTCLSGYGISYVEVQKIEKAPIDAYSTMSNGHPCISVTYRYNDMDKLAFDILHELCHIDRHLNDEHKAFIAIEGSEYSNDPREKEANAFARQMLIPDSVWNRILGIGCRSLSPFKIVKTIAEEAGKCGVSPSIAISRYKHDTGWYRTASYKSPKIFN